MGFGAIIASGEKNTLLRDDLTGCIVEARIEQFLDEPTRFALRFEDDPSHGEPMVMQAPELQCEQMITIAVQVGDAIKCLVRGPITDVRSSVQLGGAGSWYEVRGQDRRIELDRQHLYHAWTGRASETARAILSQKFTADVEQTRIVYGAPRASGGQVTQTLNQRSTDAAFIRQIARQNNLHFWIEYTCGLNGMGSTGQSLKVLEKANLKSSPSRPKDAPAAPVPVDQTRLVPTVTVKLRVNVDKEHGQNVTTFDLTMNPERPNQFAGSQEPRDVCITTAGNQEELQSKAEAALTEAGWFVEATTSTTAHMLGGVLMPHDVIEVEGLGSVHSGPYQVRAVTHVINAAEHFMDLELRRNAIGGG